MGRGASSKRTVEATLTDDQIQFIEALRPAYGDNLSEKIRFIIAQWIDERLGPGGESRFASDQTQNDSNGP